MASEQERTSTPPTHYSQWFILITAVFITCLVTANITAVKLVSVLGLVVPAAVIIFPISFSDYQIFHIHHVATLIVSALEVRYVLLCHILNFIDMDIPYVIPAFRAFDADLVEFDYVVSIFGHKLYLWEPFSGVFQSVTASSGCPSYQGPVAPQLLHRTRSNLPLPVINSTSLLSQNGHGFISIKAPSKIAR